MKPWRRRFGGYVNVFQTNGGPELKADFKSKVPSFAAAIASSDLTARTNNPTPKASTERG